MRWRRHSAVKLLEIGLGCTMNTGSASINLWQEYFTGGLDLWMADLDAECAAKVQNTTRNPILLGDQSSEADLLRWVDASGERNSFDFIVDDGSHNPAHQLEAFRVLFEHGLKPGGTYFMEDIESAYRDTCKPFAPDRLSRDRILYWIDQLLIFPRNPEAGKEPARRPGGLGSAPRAWRRPRPPAPPAWRVRRLNSNFTRAPGAGPAARADEHHVPKGDVRVPQVPGRRAQLPVRGISRASASIAGGAARRVCLFNL